MKYVKSSNGFSVVANKTKVHYQAYTYNLSLWDDASAVLSHLMDRPDEKQFIQFGKDLFKANCKKD